MNGYVTGARYRPAISQGLILQNFLSDDFLMHGNRVFDAEVSVVWLFEYVQSGTEVL